MEAGRRLVAATPAGGAREWVPGISGASAIAAGTKHLLALLEEDR